MNVGLGQNHQHTHGHSQAMRVRVFSCGLVVATGMFAGEHEGSKLCYIGMSY